MLSRELTLERYAPLSASCVHNHVIGLAFDMLTKGDPGQSDVAPPRAGQPKHTTRTS
jgi:hypothetical protein